MNALQEQLTNPSISDRQPTRTAKQWQRPLLRRLDISRDTALTEGSNPDGQGGQQGQG